MSGNDRSIPGTLTGAAGVHDLCATLAAEGIHATPTMGGAPYVDVLVATVDASRSLAVQVKTSREAMRMKGRGSRRSPHHIEWDVGKRDAHIRYRDLFFAFADLRSFRDLPDLSLMPASVVHRYFSQFGELKRY